MNLIFPAKTVSAYLSLSQAMYYIHSVACSRRTSLGPYYLSSTF